MIRKMWIMFLSLILCAGGLMQPVHAGINTDYTLTGNQADDVITVAAAQIGKTKSDFGWTVDWCAYFVSWAGKKAGANYPSSLMGTGRTLTDWFVNNKAGTFYYFRQENYDHLLKQNKNLKNLNLCVKSDRSSFTPVKGDIVLYRWNSAEANINWSHVGFVESYSGGKLKTIEGNVSDKVQRCTRSFNNEVIGFIRPFYTDNASDHVLRIRFNVNGGYVLSDEFTTNDELVVRKSDTSQTILSTMKYGVEVASGLWNAASFGMGKLDSQFLGWSRSKDGSTTVFDEDMPLRPEQIYPDLAAASATITMYAIWYKPVLHIRYHPNGGTVNSSDFSVDSSGYIKRNSNNSIDLTNWECGYGYDSGLFNAASFGLTRNGYSFVGWARNQNPVSGAIYDEDEFYRSDEIYPNLSKGDATIPLYAVWAKDDFVDIPDGVYTLTPSHAQDLRLSPANGSTRAGTYLKTAAADDSAAQQFLFESQGSYAYKITNVGSGYPIGVETSSPIINGTRAKQYEDNGSSDQRWYLSDGGGGTYYLRLGTQKTRTLDVYNADAVAGTDVWVWFIHDHPAQKWILTPVVTEKLIHVSAKAATCEQDGNKEYWKDSAGNYYSDSNGTQKISADSVVIPRKGHSYGVSTHTMDIEHMSGTMTFVCANDSSHTATKKGTLTVTYGMEYSTYTLSVKGPDGKTYTVQKEVKNTKKYIRIFGNDRYETSRKAADYMKTVLGVNQFDTVIVASGRTYADALPGSYLASIKNAPILLTRDTQNENVKAYIRKNLKKGGMVYILGGESSVGSDMEEGLDGYTVKRLAGENRYLTNIEILKEAKVSSGEILVCTGGNYADSLSASSAGRPIFLVSKNGLSKEQKEWLSTVNGVYYVVGGTGAVSNELKDAVGEYGPAGRIAGNDRYETSFRLAEKFAGNAQQVVIAYGKGFPDGLSGGPLASAMHAPLILSAENNEDKAAEFVHSRKIHYGVVIGGPALIPEKTADNIFY